MCEAYVHSAKRVALSLLSVLAVALLLSQCTISRIHEKINESSADYRGVKIEENKSPLFKKGDKYFIEVREEEIEPHFSWFETRLYDPRQPYSFSDKKDNSSDLVTYYLPVSSRIIEEEDSNIVPDDDWDNLLKKDRYFCVDKKNLLSEKEFSQLGARRVGYPNSVKRDKKEADAFDSFYIVTEREKNGMNYVLAPFVFIGFCLDVPLGSAATVFMWLPMSYDALKEEEKAKDDTL